MNLILFYLINIAVIKSNVDEYVMEYDPNTSLFIDDKTNSDLIREFSYKYTNFDTIYIAVTYNFHGEYQESISGALSYYLKLKLEDLMPENSILLYRDLYSIYPGTIFSKKKYEVNHRGVFIYTSLQD